MKKQRTIGLIFILLTCGVHSQNDTVRINPSPCNITDTIGFNISGDKAGVIARNDKKTFYVSSQPSVVQHNNKCVWYVIGSKEIKKTIKFYIWFIDPSTGEILERKKRKAPKRMGKY